MPTQIEKASIPFLLKRLRDLPPFFVYYMARQRSSRVKRRSNGERLPRTRPTIAIMANKAGIPVKTFFRISSKLSWDEIKLKNIEPFFYACGFDFSRQKSLREYVRKTMKSQRPFSHLDDAQLESFNQKCARWLMLKDQKAKL